MMYPVNIRTADSKLESVVAVCCRWSVAPMHAMTFVFWRSDHEQEVGEIDSKFCARSYAGHIGFMLF